jgi:hypothetical protein
LNLNTLNLNILGKYNIVCVCEGCFGNDATRRAEGDHDMDFDIEKGVVEPKTQPRAPKFDPRASGTLLKNVQKPKSLKPKNNMNKD